MDLPRLARRFSILVNEEEVYRSPAHSVEIKTVLLHLLYRLSTKLDGQGSARHVKILYTTHVMTAPTMSSNASAREGASPTADAQEDADMSQQLKAMFSELEYVVAAGIVLSVRIVLVSFLLRACRVVYRLLLCAGCVLAVVFPTCFLCLQVCVVVGLLGCCPSLPCSVSQ
jgi:hypothetical protein